MLKDYAVHFSPLWYTHEVSWNDIALDVADVDEHTRRIYSVDDYLTRFFNHYSSYYLAVAYKDKTECHLKYNDEYYIVPQALKQDLIKVMQYYFGLSYSVHEDFRDLMDAYYCDALKIKYKE